MLILLAVAYHHGLSPPLTSRATKLANYNFEPVLEPQEPDYSKFKHDNPESLSAAVLVVSSPRNKCGETNSPGKQQSLALRRMSHPAVRQLIGADVHDLPHGRASREAEAVSAIKQLQYEVRSRASHAEWAIWLCQLSSSLHVAAWHFRSRRASVHIQPALDVTLRRRSQAIKIFLPAEFATNRVVIVACQRRRQRFASALVTQSTTGSEGLNCNECHRVRAGVARQLQVSAPQPLNHHASSRALSCMSCHNGKRAFGGDDFSVCKRCHTGNAWHF